MKRYLLLPLLLLSPAFANAQTSIPIRVCTYNLLNFPGSTLQERAPHITAVIDSIRPDILVTQEMGIITSALTLQYMLTDSAGSRLIAAPLIDGPDTDNGLLYDSTKIALVDFYVLETDLRYIHGFRLFVLATGDYIRVLSCHLKASDTQPDREQRQRDARLIRRHMDTVVANARSRKSADSVFVVAGDMNLYSSDEPAYTELTAASYGYGMPLVDLLGITGDWHANEQFAAIHTQSPRVRQFQGGVTGGMDDRFDFILGSSEMFDRIIPGSYTAFGNDGAHFNDSINRPPNTAVSMEMANSLHAASDHIPVFVDFVFVGKTSEVEEEKEWRRREMDLSEGREVIGTP